MKAWIYRKKAVLILALCLIFCSFTLPMVYGEVITKMIQVTYRNISLWVNGKLIPSEQEPFVYEGRTFVPLRTIAEALDKEVNWNNTENKVLITDKASPRTMNIPIHSLGERYTSERFEISVLEAYISDKYPDGRSTGEDTALFIKLKFEYKPLPNGNGYKGELLEPFFLMNSQGDKLEKLSSLKCIGCHGWDLRYLTKDESDEQIEATIPFKWDENYNNEEVILAFMPFNIDMSGNYHTYSLFHLGEISIREE